MLGKKTDKFTEKGKRSKVSIFKVIKFGMKINIKVFPVLYIINNLISIAHGVSFGVVTFAMQWFFDSAADTISKNGDVSRVYVMIGALGAAFIINDVLNGVDTFLYKVLTIKTEGEMGRIIHDKIARIDPICFEDTRIHDDMEKAVAGAKTIGLIVNEGTGIFTFYLPYLIFMGVYLHNLKPQLILAIILVFIPVLLSQLLRTGIIAKFEDRAAPIRRETQYYNKVMTDREYFKETRILGAYDFFLRRLMDALKRLGRAQWSANKRTNLLELCMGLISAAGYAGIIYMLVAALLAGDITVGAFAAVFNSIGMLFWAMREIINEQIGTMMTDMSKAYNFIRFMELPERGGVNGVPDDEQGIKADHISFTYPNAKNKSVDDVSLEIKAGETVAIVGMNGAGKSTLVRLLIGLYVPTSSKVLLNGMDTSKVCLKSLFTNLSGVFQRFQQYQMTLEENVRISDCGSARDVDEALAQSGIDKDGPSFPEGLGTMLSRAFDGVDLSGGQWQRVAIARGLYRIHNVVVLDEPTAAIDPVEESRIYNKFMEISRGRTAIIVTHRLGAAKLADRVVVMNKGRIVDIGPHHELMQHNGLYAHMFDAQAHWYIHEEVLEGGTRPADNFKLSD